MQCISSFSFQCAAFISPFLSLLLISTIYYQVITITRFFYFPFIWCFKAVYIVLSLIQHAILENNYNFSRINDRSKKFYDTVLESLGLIILKPTLTVLSKMRPVFPS